MRSACAPQVGLEPTTTRLTAGCSAIELLRNKRRNRQRPILPGRVQPSTFGTGELNYCVRYGNRWDLSVITTGRGSSTHFDLLHFSVACRNVPKGFNPCGSHPDNCTNRIQYVTFTIDLIVSFVRLPFCPPVAFASFVLPFCLPGLFYQALESSPRPISIIKLHALPHFQR